MLPFSLLFNCVTFIFPFQPRKYEHKVWFESETWAAGLCFKPTGRPS